MILKHFYDAERNHSGLPYYCCIVTINGKSNYYPKDRKFKANENNTVWSKVIYLPLALAVIDVLENGKVDTQSHK